MDNDKQSQQIQNCSCWTTVQQLRRGLWSALSKKTGSTESPDKALVIDVGLTRGLVIALIAILGMSALTGYLAWGHQPAAAEEQALSAATATGRSFYLTRGTYGGANALIACASGYHMASLWEIVDPTNLVYSTGQGFTMQDSGAGPPAWGGWVRTGYLSSNANLVGQANCSVWSMTLGYGTTAYLPGDWSGATADFGIWNVGTAECSAVQQVWCVED